MAMRASRKDLDQREAAAAEGPAQDREECRGRPTSPPPGIPVGSADIAQPDAGHAPHQHARAATTDAAEETERWVRTMRTPR